MKKILIILTLLLFSCSKQTQKLEFFPEEISQKTEKTQKEKESQDSVIITVEESKFFEQDDISEIDIDSTAQINIISQIPFESFNLYDENDLVELKDGKNMRNTISLEVPQDFFFNSIQAANDISEFAKTNPASIRGIFGNLMGISEIVKGTQKVLFGIIPRNAKIIDFRFEANPFTSSWIVKSMVWKFNKKFDISLSENKISMKRRADGFGAAKMIAIENVGTNDPIKMLGENTKLSAILFKKSDLKLVKSDLQDFKSTKFDDFTVSAFFNPSMEDQTKNTLANIMKNANFAKKLDYNLSVLESENIQNSGYIEKDSIVIIYDNNNLIAFETAMFLSQYMQEKTDKIIVAVADFGQRKLFALDYDIAVLANSASLDKSYLFRKYLGMDNGAGGYLPGIADNNSTPTKPDLRKIDLFEMKIYLVSMQKIIIQSNIISNLEVAK